MQQTEAQSRGDSGAVLVDTHVHLYDCYDRALFFDSAYANFQSAASTLGVAGDVIGCMMLTETSRDHAFESLIAQHELDGGRWRFHPGADSRSLLAARDGKDALIVIAGRQIVTREGLEVLALCCNEQFNDGRPIEHSIEKVIEADGLVVLPYGVGKWSGARGLMIDKLLDGPLASRLLLGDNAGRLAMGGEPKQFARANKQGIWVLPGTDPLPFADEARSAGRYGMLIKDHVNREHAADGIKQWIQAASAQPMVYGRTDGPVRFFKKQVRMQLRKRLGKR